MKNKNKKEFRIVLTMNFFAEILFVISLYLSGIYSIKILSINILNGLSIIFSVIGMFFLFKLVKKKKKEKMLILFSFGLLVLAIIFSLFLKTKFIVLYMQIISDILKFLAILSVLKTLIKPKIKKIKNSIIISIIIYAISKVCYIILDKSEGLTFRPIMTTISIICIIVIYTLYIKFLEKNK